MALHAADPRAAGERLRQLLDELAAAADPVLRDRVDEVVGLLTGLYGAGLARVVELVPSVDGGAGLLAAMTDDDLVATLLVLHGLHPLDARARVERALDGVRPHLRSHGGDVELLDVDETAGTVRLKLLGSCDGCPSSSVTLEQAVRQAIEEAAPDVGDVVLAGQEAQPPTPPVDAPGPDVTPVKLVRKPPARPAARAWPEVLALPDMLARADQRGRLGERCEMCAAEIADPHSHLVKLDTRSLLCTCRPCYLLFTAGGAGGSNYRCVPERYLSVPEFELSRPHWEDLQIPVSVAFFFFNSEEEKMVGFYPSPAGATECLLRLQPWQQLLDANPSIPSLEPDVEAVLVRAPAAGAGAGRGGQGAPECHVVPIDVCYELVGHIRKLWRGFDGGQEVHRAIEEFFDRVRGLARPAPAAALVRES